MHTNLRGVPGIHYIAGRNFTSEYGEHLAGTEVKQARGFANLEVLVDNHFLYPYWPEGGYEYLPAHIFNHVQTKEEVLAQIKGDTTPYTAMKNQQYPGGKPEAVELAERELEDKRTPFDYQVEAANQRATKRLAQKAADDKKPVDEVVTRKITVKKAAAKQAAPQKIAAKQAAPVKITAAKAAPRKEI